MMRRKKKSFSKIFIWIVVIVFALGTGMSTLLILFMN